MSLIVNTNVSSLNAQRQMMSSSLGLDQAFERLSSGLRINSAADDAAGLQISDRLQSQILGLSQGNRNANDGISLAQTAEGAMEEITSSFQRVRTLASQAANGSNTDEDRLAIQEEIRALMTEVNRIAGDTTFGGENLLDGTYEGNFQVGADAVQTIGFSMQNVDNSTTGTISANNGFTLSGIAGIASAIGANATLSESLSDKLEGLSDSIDGTEIATEFKFANVFVASTISVSTQGNAQAVLAGMDSLIAVVDKKRAELGAVQKREQITDSFQRVRTLAAQAANGSNTDEDRLAIQEEMRALMEEVNRVAADTTFGGENLLDGTYEGNFQVGADAVQTIGFSMQNVDNSTTGTISANNGFTLSGIAGIASAIGANATLSESLSDKLEGLSDSIDGTEIATEFKFANVFVASTISVSTQGNAQAVLAGMDSLIAVVDKKRAELGAVQNRFQSTINNQANISENLSAAQSRIKDADFAAETAKLTQSQILQQASQAILSQANQRPQAALSLLG